LLVLAFSTVDDRATTTPTGQDGALARARAYLELHGDDFDRARFAGAAVAVSPPTPQNPDGGWPSGWSAGSSTVFGTCQTLDLLAGLSPVGVDRVAALRFLASAQAPDGTWSEASGVGDGVGAVAADWLWPGSSAGTYLTAYCARVFLVCATDPDVKQAVDPAAVADRVERAAQALERQVDPHGRLPGPPATHWLAAHVFRATGRQLPARRLLDVVGRLFDQLDVADLASFGADAEPGDRWSRRIAAKLLALQEPDGSWSVAGQRTPSPTVSAFTATVAHTLIRLAAE
jgi:Prenyltransferase and squalene oxidase repeat